MYPHVVINENPVVRITPDMRAHDYIRILRKGLKHHPNATVVIDHESMFFQEAFKVTGVEHAEGEHPTDYIEITGPKHLHPEE